MECPARLTALRGRRRRSAARTGAIAGTERHDECRTLTDARAADLDVAAVQPDQIVDDRQAEPETTVSTCRRAVRLPEPIEHVRQKSGIDADAGIHDLDPDALVDLAPRSPRCGRHSG